MVRMSASSLFHGIEAGGDGDEMFAADGSVRPSYRSLHDALARLGEEEFRSRSESLARSYLDQGVTFDYAGEERPFPIDAIPRVIAAEEWAEVSAGISQRVRALERFLEDLYSGAEAVKDGVIPAELAGSSTYIVDAMRGYTPPNGVRIHISGVDLVRDGSGGFRVLEDNVRTPSGVSYVLSNRRAMAQTFPELFADRPVRSVGEYPGRLLAALRAAAPDHAGRSRPSSCSPPVASTAPTSSTPCWPAPWAWTSWRPPTWSSGTTGSTCAPPPGCAAST